MILVLLFALPAISFVICIWKRRHLYRFGCALPGPLRLPLIGNSHLVIGRNEDVLIKIQNIVTKYPHPMRLWLGPKLIVFFSDPGHVEKILSSTKILNKDPIYDFMKPILGNGLVTAPGPERKRKLIQPMFSSTFMSDNLSCFKKHFKMCMEKLELQCIKGKKFDICEQIHLCFVDLVGEVVMGVNIDAQENKHKDLVRASTEMYSLIFTRLSKPWLYPDLLFCMSSTNKKIKQLRNILHEFTTSAITESWVRRKLRPCNTKSGIKPVIDEVGEFIENNPASMNCQDFVDHILTLYAASEDTVTSIASFACICFGLYPEYQETAYREINCIVGSNPEKANIDSLTKLKYLDMCIKDVLRLFPISPFIIRQNEQYFQIDRHNVPPDCSIFIPVYYIHRHKVHWERGNEFYPDHFLPEAVKKRHPYAFIPFSGGVRGCIGKLFANTCLKLILVYILQRFVIEADGNLGDVKLRTDISIRPVNGYNIRLKKRK